MFIVKTVPGLEGFSTEQNPVNSKGPKARNFCSAPELLKTAIYRKIAQRITEGGGGKAGRFSADELR